jgi:hypothetical protein
MIRLIVRPMAGDLLNWVQPAIYTLTKHSVSGANTRAWRISRCCSRLVCPRT